MRYGRAHVCAGERFDWVFERITKRVYMVDKESASTVDELKSTEVNPLDLEGRPSRPRGDRIMINPTSSWLIIFTTFIITLLMALRFWLLLGSVYVQHLIIPGSFQSTTRDETSENDLNRSFRRRLVWVNSTTDDYGWVELGRLVRVMQIKWGDLDHIPQRTNGVIWITYHREQMVWFGSHTTENKWGDLDLIRQRTNGVIWITYYRE